MTNAPTPFSIASGQPPVMGPERARTQEEIMDELRQCRTALSSFLARIKAYLWSDCEPHDMPADLLGDLIERHTWEQDRRQKAEQIIYYAISIVQDSMEVLDAIKLSMHSERDPEKVVEMVNGYLDRAHTALAKIRASNQRG